MIIKPAINLFEYISFFSHFLLESVNLMTQVICNFLFILDSLFAISLYEALGMTLKISNELEGFTLIPLTAFMEDNLYLSDSPSANSCSCFTLRAIKLNFSSFYSVSYWRLASKPWISWLINWNLLFFSSWTLVWILFNFSNMEVTLF